MMSVYIIDSMLNFPISRPVSHIFLVFMLVVFMKIKNKRMINKLNSIIVLTLLIGVFYVNYKSFISSPFQAALLE